MTDPKSPDKRSREAQLAAALRANLKRRKAGVAKAPPERSEKGAPSS
jgi:hypothetical protein